MIEAVGDIISIRTIHSSDAGPGMTRASESQLPSTICLASSRDLLVGILAVVQQKFGTAVGQDHAAITDGSRSFRFGPLIAALRRLNEQIVARNSDPNRESPLKMLSIEGPVSWDTALDEIGNGNEWISMHIERGK